MRSIKQLLNDDDSAVSPVIGVILMVAITVILAAVIASFVLGLGDETDDVSPNIKFDSDANNESGTDATWDITVDTADSNADAEDIYLRGDVDFASDDPSWGNEGDAEIKAGETVTLHTSGASGDIEVNNFNEGELTIVFETEDTSDTIQTITIPESIENQG